MALLSKSICSDLDKGIKVIFFQVIVNDYCIIEYNDYS